MRAPRGSTRGVDDSAVAERVFHMCRGTAHVCSWATLVAMPATTRTFGFILIVLGLASYFLTGRVSVTALIPAFFGYNILHHSHLSV